MLSHGKYAFLTPKYSCIGLEHDELPGTTDTLIPVRVLKPSHPHCGWEIPERLDSESLFSRQITRSRYGAKFMGNHWGFRLPFAAALRTEFGIHQDLTGARSRWIEHLRPLGGHSEASQAQREEAASYCIWVAE